MSRHLKFAHPRAQAAGFAAQGDRILMGPRYDDDMVQGVLDLLADNLVRGTATLAQLVHETGVSQVDSELMQKLLNGQAALNRQHAP